MTDETKQLKQELKEKKAQAKRAQKERKAANGTFFEKVSSPERALMRKWIHLAFAVLSIIGIIVEIYSPLCDAYVAKQFHTLIPAEAFDYIGDRRLGSYAYLPMAALLLLVVCAAISFAMMLKCAFSFRDEKKMIKFAKVNLTFGTAVAVVYSSVGLLFPMINYATGGSQSNVNVSLVAIIIMLVEAIAYAVFIGMINLGQYKTDEGVFEKRARERREHLFRLRLHRKIELLVYALCSAALAIVALLSNIMTINVQSKTVLISNHSISGWSLLVKPERLTTAGERMLSFMVFALLLLTVVMIVLSIVSLVSRSLFFPKIAVATAVLSTVSCLLVGLFGRYYTIVQNLNIETIKKIVAQYTANVDKVVGELTDYTVKSASLWWFVISLCIVFILFFRRPYSKIIEIENQIAAEDAAMLPQNVDISSINSDSPLAVEDQGGNGNSGDTSNAAPENDSPAYEPTAEGRYDFDPCPVFSEIDADVAALEESREALFEEPTLPRLVEFIVQYARNSKNHLFYTQESIATFLAGLGSTRLSILQGMSGTGKTSLPKIVAEALGSVCDIVEVESSWRDKNELLGYYNEFSKIYTPKKFTQALYRARLCPDRITFIVLDEMNLSRIEYYFSDFLSLMENDPDKRELRLLNLSIARTKNGEVIPYAGLANGHTLKIPANVWFIGTANRDESTYDISDKVYDRAHTMNFDKRATKVQYYSEEIPARYLPAEELIRLIDEAKKSVNFELEQYPVIVEVERLLEPYNISFGNRVAMQMESFVKIYASCFAVNESVIRDGLETILLSKVVRKLELKRIDDKDALAAEFEKLHLMKCGEFIRGIKED